MAVRKQRYDKAGQTWERSQRHSSENKDRRQPSGIGNLGEEPISQTWDLREDTPSLDQKTQEGFSTPSLRKLGVLPTSPRAVFKAAIYSDLNIKLR
jgi:hypothetical protein